MHNLLPLEKKNEVKTEYRWRLFIVSLFLSSLLGIILLFSLFPSVIFSRFKEEEALEKKKILNESIYVLEGQNLNTLLKETKEKLESLEAETSTHPLYIILEKALARRNEGIRITGITASPEKEGFRELTLAGIATSRPSLVEFKKNLEQDESFTVSLPVSNFAKQTEIEFTVTLRIRLE